ncbi:MAG: endonuclease/exonuclease/phosphatase family protein [Pseudomonadota bacterium]
MTEFSIATFNVKNLISARSEYYRFEEYTDEEYAWKEDWLADQLLSLDADIVGFQEIFEEEPLQAVVDAANARGTALNDVAIPPKGARHARRAIFRKLAYRPYPKGAVRWARNAADGGPGARRPGLAVLSRFGFAADPEVIQDLAEPMVLTFPGLDGSDAGSFRLDRVSRPILKVKIPVGKTVITVFNCHLKSKLGEYLRDPDGVAREADLTQYDALGRAMGSARAGLRRMAEALVLRREVLKSLEAGDPVIVLGDMNDGDTAVSSEIIAGERPFKNYAWMRRHDAKRANQRYTDEENLEIREAIEAVRLHSAEKLFVAKSLRDVVYTAAFGGHYESIDQILLSRHFVPQAGGSLGQMDYLSSLNDHITDGTHPEAPYNKLASDHGQLVAHMRLTP